MPISLPEIEAAAHSGAFGKNRIPEPTENQCNAGNYKMGRFDYHGLKIVIEQPRGTYRTGIDQKTGKRWTSRMAAHYGYIGGTKGSDGDGVDCFVGFYPQSGHVFVINQNVNGRFDEHKTMLAFPDQESAIRAYKQSYDRDWNGLASIVHLSINQLKWWLKNGDMRRPIKQADLPAEGFETMKRVYWNENNMPLDGRTLDRVLYEMRQSDEDNLLLDSVSLSEILEDAEGGVLLDALVTPFVKLERKMSILQGIMERSTSQVKPVAMQISDPFKQSGVVNVAVVYELSDGQTISIYFHNPDVTPQKIAPTDEVISWKWMLNKKDITIVVAPERGRDLDVREVARRILKLAEKNSAAFARANAKRAERMQNIQNLKDEIVTLEGELKSAQNELEVLKIQAGDDAAKREDLHIAVREALSKMGWDGFSDGSAMTMGNFRASVSGNYAGFLVEKLDGDSGSWVDAGFMSLSPDKTAQEVADGIALIVESSKPDDVEAAIASVVSGSDESLDPTSPEGYAKIMTNESLQIKYQDTLDAFFQERIAGVWRNLTKLAWYTNVKSSGTWPLFKQLYSLDANIKHVGGGRNVVGVSYVVKDGDDFHFEVGDSLKKTPEQIAAEINAAIPGNEDSGQEEAATDQQGGLTDAEMVVLISTFAYKPFARLSSAQEQTKTDVMSDVNDGISEQEYNEARDSLNAKGVYLKRSAITPAGKALLAGFHPEITITGKKLRLFAGKFSGDLSGQVGDGVDEPEEIIAAKAFLQSVIDGAKDASDLMNLLDEIDASAKALIDAGKGDEYDELIGKAAEKWAELDQQANG
jgi:hypothetical protein